MYTNSVDKLYIYISVYNIFLYFIDAIRVEPVPGSQSFHYLELYTAHYRNEDSRDDCSMTRDDDRSISLGYRDKTMGSSAKNPSDGRLISRSSDEVVVYPRPQLSG